MGTLRFFNLQQIMERHNVRTLFETGTGDGDAVRYAQFYNLDRIISVEINAELAARARANVGPDPRVEIINSTSEDAMRARLPAIPADAPVLFWLDAHFPGADYGLADYNDEVEFARRLPLQRELELIAELRPGARDFVIADDLRIYEDGPYGQGPCPDEIKLPDELRNLRFLAPWMGSHDVRRRFEHTGYLVLAPRAL